MKPPEHPSPSETSTADLDRRLILAVQEGLPLVSRPYAAVAERIGTDEATVRTRLAAMLETGIIRRIGAVPNHYAIGYTANGMSVWDIDDQIVDTVGERIGALKFVTHCYRRPRHLPSWPYNLFAMVHASSRAAAMEQVAHIAQLIQQEFPEACRQHDVLFSNGILKKTGLRIGN